MDSSADKNVPSSDSLQPAKEKGNIKSSKSNKKKSEQVPLGPLPAFVDERIKIWDEYKSKREEELNSMYIQFKNKKTKKQKNKKKTKRQKNKKTKKQKNKKNQNIVFVFNFYNTFVSFV